MFPGHSIWGRPRGQHTGSSGNARGTVRNHRAVKEDGFSTMHHELASRPVTASIVCDADRQSKDETFHSLLAIGSHLPLPFGERAQSTTSGSIFQAKDFGLQFQSATDTDCMSDLSAKDLQGFDAIVSSRSTLYTEVKAYAELFSRYWEDANPTCVTSQSFVRKRLPRGFVRRSRRFYRRGRVFWTVLATPSELEDIADDGSPYSIIDVRPRPVVVIHSDHGHCICIPIVSHRSRGLLDKILEPHQRHNHAPIHIRDTECISYPEEGMIHSSFRVFPAPGQTIKAMSRIQFDRVHYVPYNTPTLNLGSIDRQQLNRLLECFRAANSGVLWSCDRQQSTQQIRYNRSTNTLRTLPGESAAPHTRQ